jgi:signal transduction histidine kinase
MEADNDPFVLVKVLEGQPAFIETVFQHLPIGIAISKIDDSTAVFINKRFTEIYGWPVETFTDVPTFFQQVFPDERYCTEMSTMIMADIASGDANRMCWQNVHITTQSGEARVVNAKNIPFYAQNLMVSTVTDITTLAKQNERLTEIALLNAHDIRRPVATILGLLQLLKEARRHIPDADWLQHFESAIGELDEVIKQIINKTVEE